MTTNRNRWDYSRCRHCPGIFAEIELKQGKNWLTMAGYSIDEVKKQAPICPGCARRLTNEPKHAVAAPEPEKNAAIAGLFPD